MFYLQKEDQCQELEAECARRDRGIVILAPMFKIGYDLRWKGVGARVMILANHAVLWEDLFQMLGRGARLLDAAMGMLFIVAYAADSEEIRNKIKKEDMLRYRDGAWVRRTIIKLLSKLNKPRQFQLLTASLPSTWAIDKSTLLGVLPNTSKRLIGLPIIKTKAIRKTT